MICDCDNPVAKNDEVVAICLHCNNVIEEGVYPLSAGFALQVDKDGFWDLDEPTYKERGVDKFREDDV